MHTQFKNIRLNRTGKNYTASAWVFNDDCNAQLFIYVKSNDIVVDKYHSRDDKRHREALVSLADAILWENDLHDYVGESYEIIQPER